ncbi:WRKY transcription factor [Musa troglodytarum]|uniref:WRKY transcription factor n=1 Tax=Musa troglodytarum TaxID=320322 RepID=A0A9E7G7S4_9LILI|nr:WRKY transcription factor [Musa troglodytarum]
MQNDGTGSELRSTLMAELARALELVSQLQSHLDHPSAAELCKSLATEILSSIGKSILMAKSGDPDGELQAGDSPRSENSSPAFRDPGRRDLMKKRKAMHKLTNQVRLIPGVGGVEGPVDDGYSWRKYGQKDILGAKHPRAYYRCTHRSSQGCQATKQVQRSDEDPLVFDVTYLGTHTCLQRPQRAPISACLGHQSSYTLEMEGVHREEEARGLTALSFGTMTVMGDTAADLFSSLSSPPALWSPYQISSIDGGMKQQTSDSDIAEMISRGDSTSNSSLVDVAFMLQEMDFAQNFQFDAPGFDSCSFFS